ncbi:glycoside hydrolase family 2 protein [Rathayibacter sp. YIM 133350]|uniref:glycoside hydrolase family 2 protein n=1 Tax=Rathayibacter sp. YIM 133350 TaxID=3131992 RepID=UPI00307F41CA
MSITTTVLTDGWTLSLLDGPAPDAVRTASVPATVPGSVHTDLLAAGLIPDPYLDDNERLLAWIGLCDWRYTRVFERPADAGSASDPSAADPSVVELAFDGLDTVATVRLNGEVIAETRNMHRSYRFDITERVRPGENTLEVDFASPIRYADAQSLALGYRPHVNYHPYNAVRKMACSFGWDWGIDTSSSGLWRPAAIQEWSTARLASVRPVARVQGSAGMLEVHVDVARAPRASASTPLTVSASIAGTTASVEMGAEETTAVLRLQVDDVDLWWPRGYGEQPLYDVEVTLSAEGGELDSAHKRVGFRTVEFDTTPDAAGTPFTIVVNRQPVFVKGANWIPDDAFPHRVDRARYARRLEQAEFAGLNLIRVWGGGIYESEDFYDLCDERGLLTWQDFLLACAAYAEEDPLFGEIEAEAREAVTRLASHPSLVVLNGNNENVWGYADWNWELRLEGRTWGAGYYYDLFPGIVAELAPHIGYTPASPFSPDRDAHPNDPDQGTMHIWDLWNQKDYPHYRDYSPRFVSEFGWQAPPTWSTLTRSLHDDPLTPESPGMLVHQKAMEGNVKLTDGLVRHLPLPNEIEDWHWAMQLNQATAITTAVEYFRSLTPHCMGSIVWQLNDCWPATSWAAVDGDERPKPLLHALRNAHADRLVTLQPHGEGLAAVLVNDTGEEWAGELVLARHSFAGGALAEHREQVSVPARSAVTVALPDEIATTTDAASQLVRASLGEQHGEQHGEWFFAEYRDSALGHARLQASVVPADDGYALSVHAETLVRDLTVLIDKVDPDARVDSALVTLLPGESAVFRIRSSQELALEQLTDARVLRSANQLVAR